MPSNLSKVNSAHARREKFLELHGKSRLFQIRILHQIYVAKDWTHLGFESMRGYFESPASAGGLDLSRSWAMELIGVYQKYIVELGMPEEELILCSPRKLYALKDGATKANLADILSEVKHTSLENIKLNRLGVDEETCPHSDCEQYKRCRTCRRWLRVESSS